MPTAGPTCPYEGASGALVDAGEVYGPKYAGRFNVWQCPTCGATCGARKGMDPRPTGILANQELRALHKRLRVVLTKERDDMPQIRSLPVAKRMRWRNELAALNSQIYRVGFLNEDQVRKALMARIDSAERED